MWESRQHQEHLEATNWLNCWGSRALTLRNMTTWQSRAKSSKALLGNSYAFIALKIPIVKPHQRLCVEKSPAHIFISTASLIWVTKLNLQITSGKIHIVSTALSQWIYFSLSLFFGIQFIAGRCHRWTSSVNLNSLVVRERQQQMSLVRFESCNHLTARCFQA